MSPNPYAYPFFVCEIEKVFSIQIVEYDTTLAMPNSCVWFPECALTYTNISFELN